MKKLSIIVLAMLAGIVSAFAANPTLYLRGDINGWGTSDEYKFTEADGVYTLTVDSLAGTFKIANAGWDTNYGSNGQAIQIDQDYVMVSNGGNCSLAGTGMAKNVTLTFTLSNTTLKITGQEQANTYDKIYIIGDIGSGWDGDRTDLPLEKVAGTTNQFKGTFTLTGATNFIKFKAGTWIYGPGTGATDDVALEAGTTCNIYYPDGSKSYKIGAGEYTFTITVDQDAATGTIQIEGEQTYASKIYLIGDWQVGDQICHWDPTYGVEISSVSNGVYSIDKVTIVKANSDSEESGYFSFCTQLSEDGSWNLGTRYGAEANDTPIALGETKSIQVSESSFKITPGDYKITVNLKGMTVSVAKAITGVDGIDTDSEAVVSVYNMQGVQLRSGVAAGTATEGLPAGLYIVGGRKVIVK